MAEIICQLLFVTNRGHFRKKKNPKTHNIIYRSVFTSNVEFIRIFFGKTFGKLRNV